MIIQIQEAFRILNKHDQKAAFPSQCSENAQSTEQLKNVEAAQGMSGYKGNLLG